MYQSPNAGAIRMTISKEPGTVSARCQALSQRLSKSISCYRAKIALSVRSGHLPITNSAGIRYLRACPRQCIADNRYDYCVQAYADHNRISKNWPREYNLQYKEVNIVYSQSYPPILLKKCSRSVCLLYSLNSSYTSIVPTIPITRRYTTGNRRPRFIH